MLSSRPSFHDDMITILDHIPSPDEYRRVRHLIIKNPEEGIPDEHLTEVLGHCCSLQTVVLSGAPHISDSTVTSLAQNAADLEGVDLTGCRHVTDVGIMDLAALPLEWLKIGGLHGVTDAAVSTIAKSCSRLVELDLSGLPLLTPLSIRDIWSFSRKLRVLRLAYLPNLTDKAFPSPWNDDSSISSGDTEKPLPHRPTTWIEQLPPLFIRQPADNLRILDLSQCKKITDEAIDGIVKHAPRLQNLSLSGCLLTDAALESLCELGHHLDVINLSHVAKITDRGVVKLARACSNLRVVDLSFCRLLTDMSVFELAGSAALRRLSLVRVQKLTDNAIFFIAEHCPGIERLHLSYCDRLSLDAIHFLLKYASHLQHLTATGIPSLKRKGVARFSDPPPENLTADQQAVHRQFSSPRIALLCNFLNKEEERRRRCEAQNVTFTPRSDDGNELY